MNRTMDKTKLTNPGRQERSIGKAAVAATLLASGLTLSGWAAASTVPKATLHFERGELASAEGLDRLHDRVMRAARNSCRLHGVRGIARANWERECREELVGELLAAIDSERLKELHAQRRGQGSDDAS